MGVASGRGCKEVYRFSHTTYPYSSCTVGVQKISPIQSVLYTGARLKKLGGERVMNSNAINTISTINKYSNILNI